jgi:hypothetical protein
VGLEWLMNWLGVSGRGGPQAKARHCAPQRPAYERLLLGLASVAVLVATGGCGGDGGDAAPSTSRPRLTAPPAPTTDHEPPREETTATAASDSEPSTTSASAISATGSPSSTVFPTPPSLYASGDPRAEVEAAFWAYRQMRLSCTAAYPNCDTSMFPGYLTGEALEAAVQNVSAINEAGYIAERVSEYRQQLIEISTNGDTATVIACEWDPIRIYRPATADRPEHIFTEGVESRIASGTMRRLNGRWLLEHGETLERVAGGESLCD